MKKILITFLMTFISCLLIVGCARVNDKPKLSKKDIVFDVYGLAGPTSMGMAKIINDNVEYSYDDLNIKYNFKIENSPDIVVGKVLNGEAEIAAVPTNVASIIYNKTNGKYKLGAVNTLGILYLLGNEDSNITNWEGLKGKTIYLSGKGATPDYVIRYLLQKNGLNPETDVTIEYVNDHATVGQMLLGGKAEFALLPQPFVTSIMSKNTTLKSVFDINSEWKKVTNGTELPMGCIIIKAESIEQYSKAVEYFIDKYEQSINWVNSNPDQASPIIANLKIVSDAKIAQDAIPLSNIVFVNDAKAKTMLENYFTIMNEFDSKTIGGKLPHEEFYNLKK